MSEKPLERYRAKRDFSRTSEPAGGPKGTLGNRFVVHKHSATADHYDLRLELGGVLKSWAVPKGPSLNPDDKRLAVATEDHPLDYVDFEGVIPEGEYGGGPMIVWDTGDWAPMGDAAADIAKGAFKFRLAGEKLRGGWMLTRLKRRAGETKDNWLLFKEHDPAMDRERDVLAERPESVKSGLTIEGLAAVARQPSAPARARRLQPGRLTGAVKAPMPDAISPQLASVASTPPDGDTWLHEIKLDGYRTMAYLDRGTVRLITRAGLDWTKRYGVLASEFAGLDARQAVIDGEIVVLDDKGHSSFAALQAALSDGASEKLVFYAFDLLHLNGWDLGRTPLAQRKALLASLLGTRSGRDGVQYSDHVEGAGEALYDQVSEMGLEGIVSKRADAPYHQGRSKTWLKIKAQRIEDFVIAGYTPSEAAGGIGALAMAEWEEGELAYRGKVGTGFDTETMRELQRRLTPLHADDARLSGMPKDVRPVRPVLSARIQYATRTGDNAIRHGVFRGLRSAELSTPAAGPRERLISDADLAGIWVTNPTRRLFGRSGPTKLDIAVYYAAIGDFMLPHLFNRPVSLFRCPSGMSQDCFFQRHAFTGMPVTLGVFETRNSDEEAKTYISVEDARGYLALAQFGVVEFHAWGTHVRHLDQPDRMIFDLDPGEGITWREVVEAAVHLSAELEGMGLVPFVKTSGGRGLHIVVPITPEADWKRMHQASSAIATRLAATGRDTFVTIMGEANRKRRIFIDFHRNARSATAVAAYSLRARPHLPASTPVSWQDLESIDSPEDLNYSSLPALLTTSGDPWAAINESQRPLPA